MGRSELVRAEEASDSGEGKVIGRTVSVSACCGTGEVVTGGERPIEPQHPPLFHWGEVFIERSPLLLRASRPEGNKCRKFSSLNLSRVMIEDGG